MRAPKNRRVFAVGASAVTPLGQTLGETFRRAAAGETGFGLLSRCEVETLCSVVGEVPDWDPRGLDFVGPRDAYNWNAGFVHLTMLACRDALADAGLEMDDVLGPRTGCLMGSALNGSDAYRDAAVILRNQGRGRVGPYLLPNLCGNLPGGKAGIMLGFTGLSVSPQGACASGNHAIGLGARLIRDGDLDVVMAGGAEAPITPEIVVGFENMGATLKVRPGDRAYDDPSKASRPFSRDRRGFVLSEGAGTVVLVAEDLVKAHGLHPIAEVLGVGWASDAYHVTKPHQPTIVRTISDAISDADLSPGDIGYVNAHGTSTPIGDSVEVACLREVFGKNLPRVPVSSSKSQLGHSLGASAGIEAALVLEGIRRKVLLPTANHLPDENLSDVDVIPIEPRHAEVEFILSNSFGFGGTNCCIVFRSL